MSQPPWRDYASAKRLRIPAERIAPAAPGLRGCSETDRGVANCYRTFPVRCGGRRPEEMQPVFAVTVYSLGSVFVFPLEIFKYDQIRPRYLVSAFHVNQIQPPTGSRAGRCRKGFPASLSALAKREHPLHGDLEEILLKNQCKPSFVHHLAHLGSVTILYLLSHAAPGRAEGWEHRGHRCTTA